MRPHLLLALILSLPLAPGLAQAQSRPDSLRVDSLRVDSLRVDSLMADTLLPPVFEIQGIQVSVPRPEATSGGASAVVVKLDSVGIRAAPTLEQVLRNMPLVQIRRNSRGEAQPALRGAKDRQVAVLMDGVPLTLGWDARTDLSIIPLNSARSIRLVRGLSSVLMGPNVLGGAVEVNVARGSEERPAPAPVTIGAGLDQTGAVNLSATGGFVTDSDHGTWEVRGGGGFVNRDGFRLASDLRAQSDLDQGLLVGANDLRLNSDEERFDAFASARYRGDGGGWVSATGSGIRLQRGVAPEAHVTDPRLWRYPYQRRTVAALSAGTGMRDTGLGRGDLEASLGIDLGRTEIESFSDETYENVVETEAGNDRTLTFRTSGDLQVRDDTDLRAAFTFGDVHHEEILDGAAPNEYQQRLWSLGGEYELHSNSLLGIDATSGTRTTLGLTLDGADTPKTSDKPALGRLWDWGGRFGLSTLVGQNALLHASISRRTRFPALRELYSGALGRFEPNPELRPEEMFAQEVGATLTRRSVEVQVVGFHQTLSNGIVRTSTVDDQGNRKFKRINQDQVRSLGVEILASAPLGPLAVSGDMTLQHVRGINPDGSQVMLEYEPAFAGKLMVEGPLPLKTIGLAEVRYVGDQFCQNPELGGLDSFDSNPRLDLGLQRRFSMRSGGALQWAHVSAWVDNVSDEAIFDQCGLPQPGRTFRIQLSLN